MNKKGTKSPGSTLSPFQSPITDKSASYDLGKPSEPATVTVTSSQSLPSSPVVAAVVDSTRNRSSTGATQPGAPVASRNRTKTQVFFYI